MKNIFVFLLLAVVFTSTSSFAKEESELELLTPEQFASLYDADKKTYIKLLRQAAAELSFQESLGFFEGLNVTTPVWVRLLSTRTEARTYTEQELQGQLSLLNSQADEYLASRNPVEYATQAATHLLNREADARNKAEKARIVDSLFKRRNAVLDQIAVLPESAQVNLARSLRPLDSKFYDVKIKARGLGLTSLRSSVQASLDAYDEKLNKLKPAALEIARKPGLRIQVVERASDPVRPVEAQPDKCVRCVYGGFPVVGTTSCSSIKTSAQMTTHLGELQLPPPMKIEDFNCSDAKPVMCSPLLFGALEGKAVCVAPSSSATRACMNAVGNNEESYRSTDKFIQANVPAARLMMARFKNICNYRSLCYAGAKRSDIQQTCGVVKERMQKFIEGMRTIRGTPAPAAPPPAAAPTTIAT